MLLDHDDEIYHRTGWNWLLIIGSLKYCNLSIHQEHTDSMQDIWYQEFMGFYVILYSIISKANLFRNWQMNIVCLLCFCSFNCCSDTLKLDSGYFEHDPLLMQSLSYYCLIQVATKSIQ